MLKFCDVHTHLSDKKLMLDIDGVRCRYLNAGLTIVIDSGYDLSSSITASQNAKKFSEVFFTAGIHPENVLQAKNNDFEKIFELLKQKKCLAVGEIGLDYHYAGYDKELQIQNFKKQIEFASSLNVPFVVHSRDACEDTVKALLDMKGHINNGFLMHCYAESYEISKVLADLGGYFSFGGVVTFKNSRRGEVAKKIPLDRILVETDAPYLAPVPLRSQLNEPKNIIYNYNFLANLFEKGIEDFCQIVNKNLITLFKKLCSQTEV